MQITAQEKSNFTEKEAAQYTSMSQSFLRHARIDGNRESRTPAPKFIRIGRSIRYPREELDEWLKLFPRQSHLYEDVKQKAKQEKDSHTGVKSSDVAGDNHAA